MYGTLKLEGRVSEVNEYTAPSITGYVGLSVAIKIRGLEAITQVDFKQSALKRNSELVPYNEALLGQTVTYSRDTRRHLSGHFYTVEQKITVNSGELKDTVFIQIDHIKLPNEA